MRASRLLSVLMLLQARGRMTAQELAGELEVSVRTVYRDIESLGAAGVPVYADRGPAGGYQLIGGYRTRLTGLSGDEAESLFLAGLPGAAAELGLGTVLAGAQLKLLAALPPELRSRVGRIRERFHLDAPGWYSESDETPFLAAIADAVWNQRLIRVGYRRAGSPGKEVQRTLEPLGVVLKAGVWYLVARALASEADAASDRRHLDHAGEIRTYRVGRILALTTLDAPFERPEGFDLGDYWQSWSRRFEASSYREEAVVRLSPRGRERAPFLLSPLMARAVAGADSLPDDQGWVRVVLPVESADHALADLLRLGADVEVIAPDTLRERFAQTVEAMAVIYRTG